MSQYGHPIFAVIDDWEGAPFRARFTGTSVVERLGAPVYSAGGPTGITVRVFAVRGALTIVGGG